MTAVQTYTILCNGCGALYGSTPPLARATDIREQAASVGWVHRLTVRGRSPSPSEDFCARCVPERHKPKKRPRPPILIPPDLADWMMAILRGGIRENRWANQHLAKQALETIDRQANRPKVY